MKFIKYRKKIAVCIPLGWNYVPRPFFLNCLGMMDRAHKHGYELDFQTHTGCYMDQCRDKLVGQAQKGQPDYILWLDADQLYPYDTIEILMKHVDNGCRVVGGATPRRSDGRPLIYEFTAKDDNFGALPIALSLNRGLVQVDAMGFGGVMTHPSVFGKIPAPRFKMWWSEPLDMYVGEDVQFYKLCKEHNIKVWCDTDLHYGHLMMKPVLFNEAFLKKEEGANG